MKTEYFVSKTAGRDVAGIPNPGAGKPIFLTNAQAEHPLRIGHIKLSVKKQTLAAKKKAK